MVKRMTNILQMFLPLKNGLKIYIKRLKKRKIVLIKRWTISLKYFEQLGGVDVGVDNIPEKRKKKDGKWSWKIIVINCQWV